MAECCAINTLSLLDIPSSTSVIMSSMEYAKELLESVKENFYVPEAVDDMAECCAIFAKEFGETDIKCAEPYFYYGKALLEMSRLKSWATLWRALTSTLKIPLILRLRALMCCPTLRRLPSRRTFPRLRPATLGLTPWWLSIMKGMWTVMMKAPRMMAAMMTLVIWSMLGRCWRWPEWYGQRLARVGFGM